MNSALKLLSTGLYTTSYLLKLVFDLEQSGPAPPTLPSHSMQAFRSSSWDVLCSLWKTLANSCLPFKTQFRRHLCWETLTDIPKLTSRPHLGSHSPNTIYFYISILGLLVCLPHNTASNLRASSCACPTLNRCLALDRSWPLYLSVEWE